MDGGDVIGLQDHSSFKVFNSSRFSPVWEGIFWVPERSFSTFSVFCNTILSLCCFTKLYHVIQ